jgi:hypothetical protein
MKTGEQHRTSRGGPPQTVEQGQTRKTENMLEESSFREKEHAG